MDREEVRRILKQQSERVPFGIYAIRRGSNNYELVNGHASSKSEIKKYRHMLKSRGIKVYCNGI